jgi:hypothetical protein
VKNRKRPLIQGKLLQELVNLRIKVLAKKLDLTKGKKESMVTEPMTIGIDIIPNQRINMTNIWIKMEIRVILDKVIFLLNNTN